MERKLTLSRNHPSEHEAVTSRHMGAELRVNPVGLFVLLFKFARFPGAGYSTFVGMNPIFWSSPICRFGQKHPLFLLPPVSVGTSYQRGDDFPETTNPPRALQALFFPACKPLQAVFRVCA